MPYVLPAEIAETVRHRVQSGLFTSEEEVLKAAFRALDDRDQEMAAIQAGLADLEAGRVSSLADVDARMRAKFAIGSAR